MNGKTATLRQVSVAICSHNPRLDYLHRTIHGLRRQTLPLDSWNLLIIDNDSNPSLGGLLAIDWHPSAQVVRETALGLTNARLRAIRESDSDILVFVDDDNVLAPNYLEEVVRILSRMPMLGCIGAGQIIPEFEVQPAQELAPYVPMLALRSESKPHWSNDVENGRLPWGAGMVVTRDVANAVVADITANPLKRELGRRGVLLNSCEDDEFSWTACRLGLGHGIFPELNLLHLIPGRRVEQKYLLQLAEGHTYSRILFSALHERPTHSNYAEPSISAALQQAFSFQFDTAARELARCVSDARLNPIDRAFRRATRRGARRALDRLRELSMPSPHAT